MKAKFLGTLLGGLAFLTCFATPAAAEPPNTLADLLGGEADAQPAGKPEVALGPKRLAVPPTAEVKAALAKVQGIFSTEYAAAKTADAKAKLAKQLASHAAPDQPPAARTALLREAVRLAVEAGDVNVALEAGGKMIDAFDVDRDAAMLEVYRSLLRTASPDAARDLGQSILKFVDEAIRGGRDDAAEKAVPVLLSVSRKARDPLLVKAAIAMKLRLTERAAMEARLAPLRAKLAESPDDPQANLELGQLLCFTAGNWKEGLPMLAKSSDANLAAAVRADLEAGRNDDCETAVRAGDFWRAWGASQKPDLRAAAENRGSTFYSRALADLTGLEKVRVEKCLTDNLLSDGNKGAKARLVDLREVSFDGSSRAFTKDGTWNPNSKFSWQGKEHPDALFYPPPDHGTTTIRYNVPQGARKLQGIVGVFEVPNMPAFWKPSVPVSFKIVGDGRTLWESPPLKDIDSGARFSVDVSHVKAVELIMICTGRVVFPHAAWFDTAFVR